MSLGSKSHTSWAKAQHSWLFAGNLHIKVISDQMGHAQISTTADIYGHLIRRPAEVTNAFEKIRPAAS